MTREAIPIAKPRGWMNSEITKLLSGNPDKEFTDKEVAKAIGWHHTPSVYTALNGLHRNKSLPVWRVRSHTYRWGEPKEYGKEPNDLIEFMMTRERAVVRGGDRDNRFRVGLMLEVAGYYKSKVLLVDEDEQLWIVTAERLITE